MSIKLNARVPTKSGLASALGNLRCRKMGFPLRGGCDVEAFVSALPLLASLPDFFFFFASLVSFLFFFGIVGILVKVL